MMEDYELLREYIREALAEDVRKVGNKYCAYVDDKLTKKEKEKIFDIFAATFSTTCDEP